MLLHNQKIVGQRLDTLVVSYICTNFHAYMTQYLPVLNQLEKLKETAKSKDDFGVKFVKSDLGLSFGEFKISSRGNGAFAYYLENDSFQMWLSTVEFNKKDTVQLKIRYRSHYLFFNSPQKALLATHRVVDALIGSSFKTRVDELHLATDVAGVQYQALDINRFQTKNLSNQVYSEILDCKEYGKARKVTGYQFGKGDFLFRIYDKTKKIRLSTEEAYIKYLWLLNGWDENSVVFRHEAQFRRGFLRKFIPCDFDGNELDLFLSKMDSLWFKAVEKLEYVELSNDEILRINDSSNADTIRQIFHRAKEDGRTVFWDSLRVWNGMDCFDELPKYEDIRQANISTAKRMLKGYIGAVYRASGGDVRELANVVREVEKQFQEYHAMTLHDYGLSKIASDFCKNTKNIIKYKLNPEFDYSFNAREKLTDFRAMLCDLDTLKLPQNKPFYKDIKKAVELLSA